MKKLAILGASGHGRVIADAALLSGFDDVVFFDDAWPKLAANGRWQVVGDSAQLLSRCREFEGYCSVLFQPVQSTGRVGLAGTAGFRTDDVRCVALAAE